MWQTGTGGRINPSIFQFRAMKLWMMEMVKFPAIYVLIDMKV
jgi:hypothetical protein